MRATKPILFWLEIMLAIVLPLILLVQRRVRSSANGLYFSAVLVVLGFITNRMNVSITGFEGSTGVRYFPKWTELAVTGMIIAAGFALFGLAVKYLPIFPKHELQVEEPPEVESDIPANFCGAGTCRRLTQGADSGREKLIA